MTRAHHIECSICSLHVRYKECRPDGWTEGYIGIIPITFCPTCRVGVTHFVQTYCCNREIGCAVDEELVPHIEPDEVDQAIEAVRNQMAVVHSASGIDT